MTMIPGLTAALIGVALWTRRESSGKLAWLALALLCASCAAPWMLKLRASGGSGARNEMGLGAAVGRQQPVGTPYSGELVFTDGGFARLADPLLREQGGDLASGIVEEGWQKRLLASMSDAIKGGQEQVLMVFSRQGCPWCDRLVPVLQNAIQRRAGNEELDALDDGGEHMAPEATAFVGASMGPLPAGAGGLVFAPLRVFIFDAAEFPYLAQTFRVEAFPTLVAWGAPGVTPMAAQGYLDSANLDRLLEAVATAKPGKGGRGGRKRRGLFR